VSPNHLMSLSPRITPRAAQRIAAACGAGALLLGAAACGSSDPTTPANAAQSEGTSQNGGSTQTGQGQMPGASGKVAAVTDTTAQVQGTDGQVAVTWNGTTTFTKQVSATLADVKVGSCVVVQSADDSASSSTTAPTTAPTKVTATTVRITAKATDGTCSGGFGGAGGGGPSFNGGGGSGNGGGQPPAGANPEGGTAPGSGATGTPRVRGSFGGAFGEVTAVSATGFTVKSTVPQFNGTNPSSGSTPSTTTSNVSVTVGSKTTYTTTGKGAATDVAVGACLRAQGTTDSTGAVTAKTIELSHAVGGECTTGFRRNTAGGASDQGA
jgi:hypothetical protein